MKKILFLILIFGLIIQINAIDTGRQERLDFGHVLYINSIKTNPENLIPGQVGELNIIIENKAVFPLYDLRTELKLPTEISFYEDISKRKISKIEAGETKELSFKIIPLPSSTEGIYKSGLKITYLNHVATEREENDSFGIVIRGKPNIFSEIEKSDIYKDNLIGTISVNFVNNDLSNIKFLTIELKNNEKYSVLSSNKIYIGDLDSDDFQSADFKINVKTGVDEIILPIIATYKDSFNKDYTQEINLVYKIKDNDTKNNNIFMWIIIVAIIVIFIIIGLFMQRSRKRIDRDHKLKIK